MSAENKEMPKIFKRTAKDSVFTHLFSEPKYLLELYRALHPEDKVSTEKDIADITIRNVITDNMYNDLGFRVGKTLLILIEAQSTWSPNIIIRELMYLMQTYNNYFTENSVDLYASKKIELPKPEFYVIFTGERKEKKDYISLKEEFFPNAKDLQVDVRTKILYDGKKGDIINQYVSFAKVCNDQIKKHKYTKEAIKEILRICIGKNVLAEYLKSREVEIMDIMTALFDEDEINRRYLLRVKRESLQEGLQQGMQQGMQQGKAEAQYTIAVNLLKSKNMSITEIALATGLSVDEVQSLSNTI